MGHFTTDDRRRAFYCASCDRVLINPAGKCSTGYGVSPDNVKTCFDCCGADDVESMRLVTPGSKEQFAFYLTLSSTSAGMFVPSRVTNWPGTLSIPIRYSDWGKSRHYAFSRYVDRWDVWFTGPNGYRWHGVNRGDNQILRCRCTGERRTLPQDDDRFLVASDLINVEPDDRERLAFCLSVMRHDACGRKAADRWRYRLHSQGGYPYRTDRPHPFAVS